MLKKFVLAFLLLPVASIAVADQDGPNPGDDNPGSTTMTFPFSVTGGREGGDMCISTANWCAEQFSIARDAAETKGRGKKRVAANAEAWADLACRSAARAGGYWEAWFEGRGRLDLTRHGNHGAMHHIQLRAGLTTGTFTVARAGARAGAWAGASAYSFAGALTLQDVCGQIDIDEETFEWCAWAEAAGIAESEAQAQAASFAGSQAAASSGSVAGVLSGTEVWAANIEEFHAVVAASAGSFSSADAEAFAAAFAEAYASAFAHVYAQACVSGEIADIYREVCSAGDAEAAAQAYAFALAYAEAQASAFTRVRIDAVLPVLYINENGTEDTIVFGHDEFSIAGRAALDVSCEVPEEPEE